MSCKVALQHNRGGSPCSMSNVVQWPIKNIRFFLLPQPSAPEVDIEIHFLLNFKENKKEIQFHFLSIIISLVCTFIHSVLCYGQRKAQLNLDGSSYHPSATNIHKLNFQHEYLYWRGLTKSETKAGVLQFNQSKWYWPCLIIISTGCYIQFSIFRSLYSKHT